MATYSVKEVFYTLQGEGSHAGRPAVFCRFAGCNLWTGREADRATAVCRFCDTDFVGTDGTGGGKFDSASALAARIASLWPQEPTPSRYAPAPQRGSQPPWGGPAPVAASHQGRFVVFTGGEPLLQLDEPLIDALHAEGFMIAVETNGTIKAPAGIDWLCVSPKAGAPLVQRSGDELKVVMPQEGIDMAELESLPFSHYRVQPMDGPRRDENTQWAVRWCMEHPRWQLSLQTHKFLGIR